jgi:signal transduction histidine kinase
VGAALPVGVRLDVRVEAAARVRGRPGELNHVFLNLLDNAVRAVGASGQVRVRGSLENGSFVVAVDDTGPGVAEADRDRIFEPFYTTRAAGQGTGLGLSIAKQVVSEHGGAISVGASDLGGASFRVRLPVAAAGGETVVQSTTSRDLRG